VLQESRKGKEMGCKLSFWRGANSLFAGADMPKYYRILVKKGCKQDAKLQKKVKKVCKKRYVERGLPYV